MAKGIWVSDHQFMPLGAAKSFLGEEVVTRQRSTDFFTLGMFLPNPDPVLKAAGKDIAVYRELLTDPHVGAVAGSRKAGVKSMLWEIDRGKSKSRPAKFVEEVFEDFDVPETVSQMLSACDFGLQPMEIMWQNLGKFIVPQSVEAKPPEWFVFGDNNELRFRTRENWNGEELPPNKFLLPRHEATYQNPYGFPLLSRAFWWVAFKKGSAKFWLTFAEKYGMPWPIGKVPPGSVQEKRNKMLQGLENMVQDAVAVIDDDETIQLLEAGGKSASSDLYKSLIEMCNGEISKGHLGQTLTTEMGSKGGSYAASNTHAGVRQDLVISDKRIVEGAMNHLIRMIHEINFGTGERPKFCLYEEEDVDKVQAERDEILTRSGVVFRKEYFQENYGLEEKHFDVKPMEATPPDPSTAPAPVLPGNNKSGIPAKPTGEKASAYGSFRVLSPHSLTLRFASSEDATPADQAALDKAGDDLPAEGLQAFAEGLLKPIWPLLEKGGSPEEVLSALGEAYPKMDTAELESALTNALFVSEVWGRLNAST